MSRELGAHSQRTARLGSRLPPRVLAGLRDLELIARTAVDGMLSGLHRSRQPGFSLEFEDYRPHVPGEDPRWIDWNAYARSGRLLEKRFAGETTAPLVLLMDTSASMDAPARGEHAEAARRFVPRALRRVEPRPSAKEDADGEVSKLEYARWLAAALAWLSLGQRDPVGLAFFADDLLEYLRPGTRSDQWARILARLDAVEARADTALERSAASLRARVRRRGMLAVISDFYCDPVELLRGLRPLVYRGQDLMLLHVLSGPELEPRMRGPRVLVDLETREQRPVSREFVEREYPERLRAHVQSLQRAAGEMRASYLQLDTREPLDRALRAFLGFRRRRP